jgi:hypothetical protein
MGAGSTPTPHLLFDGSDDTLIVPADASLADLPSGDFTVEWAGTIASGGSYVDKQGAANGWMAYYSGGTSLSFAVGFDAFDYRAERSTLYTLGETVRHFACVFEEGTRAVRIYINGVEAAYDFEQIDEEGVYTSDAAEDLYVYSNSFGTFSGGKVNWLRISDSARYTGNFSVPSLTAAPATDGATVLLYDFTSVDPAGTADDLSVEGNNGAITGATRVDE